MVTNPNEELALLTQSFTVEEGGYVKPWTVVIGERHIRPNAGRSNRIYVNYGNKGNIDAIVPLVITFDNCFPGDLRFPFRHELLVPSDEFIDFSKIPPYIFLENNILNPDDDQFVYPFVVKIPAGGQFTTPIDVVAGCAGKVTAEIGPPWSLNEWDECAVSLMDFVFKFVPLEACYKLAFNQTYRFIKVLNGIPVTLKSLIISTALDIAKCAASTTPYGIIVASAITAIDNMAKANMGLDFVKKCASLTFPKEAEVNFGGVGFDCISAIDPNFKAGVLGAGSSHFVAAAKPLSYAVFFENKPDATAPAQKVIITDQLDTTKLDLSTLSLGPISFGDRLIIPPAGLSVYTTDVDLGPANNLIVRIQANLSKTSGLLQWIFTSLDPATGQPTNDPVAGFLPPNSNPPAGEGSVVFAVMPKAGLSTGTTFSNLASIVFDSNDAILTPVWLNTLDNTNPESQVAALTATQTNLSFPVQWSGTDVGAGIKDYTIYVSKNGEPFTPFLSNTTATSATFIGETGNRYAFYSSVRDQVGNQEADKNAPDTITQVVGDRLSPPWSVGPWAAMAGIGAMSRSIGRWPTRSPLSPPRMVVTPPS
ncbi:MAG: hypothetical protein U1F76_21585 [Candidatus Competibacteraceae bacterium]